MIYFGLYYNRHRACRFFALFSIPGLALLFAIVTLGLGFIFVLFIGNAFVLYVLTIPAYVLGKFNMLPLGIAISAILIATAIFGPGLLRRVTEPPNLMQLQVPEVSLVPVSGVRSVELRVAGGQSPRDPAPIDVYGRMPEALLLGGELHWIRVIQPHHLPVKLALSPDSARQIIAVPDDGGQADITVTEETLVESRRQSAFKLWEGPVSGQTRSIIDHRNGDQVVLQRQELRYIAVDDVTFLAPGIGTMDKTAKYPWEWESTIVTFGAPYAQSLRDDLIALGLPVTVNSEAPARYRLRIFDNSYLDLLVEQGRVEEVLKNSQRTYERQVVWNFVRQDWEAAPSDRDIDMMAAVLPGHSRDVVKVVYDAFSRHGRLSDLLAQLLFAGNIINHLDLTPEQTAQFWADFDRKHGSLDFFENGDFFQKRFMLANLNSITDEPVPFLRHAFSINIDPSTYSSNPHHARANHVHRTAIRAIRDLPPETHPQFIPILTGWLDVNVALAKASGKPCYETVLDVIKTLNFVSGTWAGDRYAEENGIEHCL